MEGLQRVVVLTVITSRSVVEALVFQLVKARMIALTGIESFESPGQDCPARPTPPCPLYSSINSRHSHFRTNVNRFDLYQRR
jgi:hypothetical protein